MSNSENYLLKALNNKTKFISQKANENITTLEENNNKKKPNYIINNKKKIIKTKILIPNKKCHFKKINKTLQERTKPTLTQKNIANKKLNPLPIRKQSYGFIKRNNNFQLHESNTSTNFHIKTKINNSKRDIAETSYKNLNKNERIKLIPKSPINKAMMGDLSNTDPQKPTFTKAQNQYIADLLAYQSALIDVQELERKNQIDINPEERLQAYDQAISEKKAKVFSRIFKAMEEA